jgi:hypothetical protein
MNNTANFGKETLSVELLIIELENAGLTIQRATEVGYNVISNATGAVLERMVTVKDLERYKTCMAYVAKKHGREVESFRYTKPVHNNINGFTGINI